jgi:lipopolysaccharide export system permease protein
LRVLNKYIVQDFLITFIMTVMIFTFIMCVGAVVKAIDLLARGVSGWFILQVFSYNIPFVLTFSIPISVLTTILLQFGRMSFDGEVTAMKACGLSMWQIVSPIVLLSIGLSIFCFYLHNSLSPRSHFAQRQVLVKVGMEEPVNLLEEGRFVKDFPGLMVYIAKRDGQKVQDIVVYEMNDEGTVVRNIRAKSGELKADKTNQVMLIDLYDVRIDQPDKNYPLDPSRSRFLNAQHYPVRLDISDLLDEGKITKKTPDMSYMELIRAIRDVRGAFPDIQNEDLLRQRMKMVVELHERLALSLSCFAFAMLGIPLGLISRRRESSIGIGISLMVVFVFYFFIIIADSLVKSPQYHPDLIVWIPIILAEVVGLILLEKAN